MIKLGSFLLYNIHHEWNNDFQLIVQHMLKFPLTDYIRVSLIYLLNILAAADALNNNI